jgi:hypothetical protein
MPFVRQLIRAALFILTSIAATGCAADKELRQNAKVLSIYVTKVNSDAAAFSAARDRVAVARTSTLEFLETETLKNVQSIQVELAARQITQDKDWLAFFDSLRNAPELIAKQRQELAAREADASSAIASAKSAVEVRGDKLTEVSKALAKLSDPPSSADEVRFLADFVKQVNAGIESKKTDASTVAATSVVGSELKSVSK